MPTLKLIPFLAAAGLCCGTLSHAESRPLGKIVVANANDYAVADEAVHLRLIDLGLEAGSPEAASIVAASGDRPVRAQAWDRDGDRQEDTVTLILDLAAGEKREVALSLDPAAAGSDFLPPRTQAEISRKFGGSWNGRVYEGGAFQNVQVLDTPPEHTDHSFFIRYEGPGWESEKVGYRFYLDWRNGFDIFGKLTPALVLKDVGQDGFDSYHEPAPWGMDLLKVGNALGSGGYGLWVDSKAERVSKTGGLRCEILENGPSLSQFRVTYKDWEGSGQEKMDLVADLSIEAGSRLTWVRLRPEKAVTQFCAGLVKHAEAELLKGDTDITGEAFTYLATWGKQSLDGTDLGMAIILRKKDLAKFTADELNEIALFKTNRRAIEYAFLAAWSQEPGGIATKEAFVEYLERTVERLTLAPRVDIYSALDAKMKAGAMTSEKALDWTLRFADSTMRRRGDSLAYGQFDPESGNMAEWSYTTGLLSKAMYDIAQPAGKPEYAQWAKNVISSYVKEDGSIHTYRVEEYNIDQVNSGKMLLQMHAETGEERYRLAADLIRTQLEGHPRTKNGAFWHKKVYPWQVWLDGVYMGIPFLIGYEKAYSEKPDYDLAVHEFLVCEEKMRDPETGLYYHCWDESKQMNWADPETGLSSYFWGRGLGWYAMALVDSLERLPKESHAASELERLLGDLAAALVKAQDPEKGVWYQILDRPDAVGNYPESSASCMFAYALAKGVNNGWLDESYREPARKAFEGIVKEFVRTHADGSVSLSHMCRVAGLGFGRDGSYKYYMSEPIVIDDPKGAGPFLLAGYQVAEMLKR